MPDLQQIPLQDRPDPAVLLIDAVINRQDDLAQRLSQQLVHRQGLTALEQFLEGTLLQTCGPDGVQWLRDQLSQTAITASETPPPRAVMGSLLKEALHEALAPLRQYPTSRVEPATPASTATDPLSGAPQTAAKPADDPWELRPLTLVSRPAAAAQPAPRPADLAELRAWLNSDAA